MKDNRYMFESAPVPKAVLTMALPTIITMLVVVIYNMADTFFIGQTHDPLKVAAVSLATPVFMVLMALGNLFGIGGTSAISRSLGEGKDERAKHISSFACYASIGTGVLMCAIFLIFMNGILRMIGANDATFAYAKEYLTWCSFGAPFVIFSTCFGNILRSEGQAARSMIGNMIGTVVNIILDPVMILIFDWGVAGAAIATVIGNVCASIYYIVYFLSGKSQLSISPKYFKAGDGIAKGTFAIGVPASLNNILMSVANIVLNNALVGYGNDQVAAMGIAMKANMLVVLLQIGLCAGIQPLIGYSYGSRNLKRLKKVFWFTALCAVIMGTVLTIFMISAREQILRAFINDDAVVAAGLEMMVALQLSGPVIGLLFLAVNTIQGMGKALPSLILTLARQGIVFIPLVYLLNFIFGLDGVIYAQPVADYCSIIIGQTICFFIFRNLDKSIKA